MEQALQYGQPWTVNPSLSRVDSPEVLDRINGVLEAMCCRSFINPYTLVNAIKLRLGEIGIEFSMPIFHSDEGAISLNVEQPIYGQTLNGHIGASNGVSEKIPGGLVIKFNWVKVKGYYTFEVELQRKMDNNMPLINEPITEKWTFAGSLRKERAKVRKYKIGKSYKRKYTKRKYGVVTPKGFSHKKMKPIKAAKNY